MKMWAPKRICDEDCNHCSLMEHNTSNRYLTLMLNKAYEVLGDDFYVIVESYCPNLTCCNECHIDDFCHIEGCTIMANIDKVEK